MCLSSRACRGRPEPRRGSRGAVGGRCRRAGNGLGVRSLWPSPSPGRCPAPGRPRGGRCPQALDLGWPGSRRPAAAVTPASVGARRGGREGAAFAQCGRLTLGLGARCGRCGGWKQFLVRVLNHPTATDSGSPWVAEPTLREGSISRGEGMSESGVVRGAVSGMRDEGRTLACHRQDTGTW